MHKMLVEKAGEFPIIRLPSDQLDLFHHVYINFVNFVHVMFCASPNPTV